MKYDCYFIFKTNMPSVLLEVLLKNYGFECPILDDSNGTSKLMKATTNDITLINQFKEEIAYILQDFSEPPEIENIKFYYCEQFTSGTMGDAVSNIPDEVFEFYFS